MALPLTKFTAKAALIDNSMAHFADGGFFDQVYQGK